MTDTLDGRSFVAIGCAGGVWIGSRHDSRCMYSHSPWSPSFLTLGVHLAIRRVLDLRMVSQCAMLEGFGIFLVLADNVGGMKRRAVLMLLTAGFRSRSLLTISKRSFPHHLEQQTLHRHPKSSVGTRTYSSLPSATLVVGHLSYI